MEEGKAGVLLSKVVKGRELCNSRMPGLLCFAKNSQNTKNKTDERFKKYMLLWPCSSIVTPMMSSKDLN